MSDLELEAWQKAWHSETEPLPELKKRVQRQSRWWIARTATGVVLLLGIGAFAIWAALLEPSAVRVVWAVGVWITILAGIVHRAWNQRQTWRPSAQTTLAFAELMYRRALAKVRAVHFSVHLVWAYYAFYAVLCVWQGKTLWQSMKADPLVWIGVGAGMLLTGVAYWMWMRWLLRRRNKALEKAKKFLDELQG
ncbi:MAG TPA: hypothetical protein VKZ53_15995 [Candidatus Angelobacter sp.]|nr:hypothetical protein [Candidatus Angelobacter sp.]